MSIVFTRKTLVDETFIRKSTNICKTIVEIDASQLYPYSMCQPMLIGFYLRWVIDSETSSFTPRQKKAVALKIWSSLTFDVHDLIVNLRASTLQADSSVLIGFVLIAKLCLKQWVALTTFLPVKSAADLSLKKISYVPLGKENSKD